MALSVMAVSISVSPFGHRRGRHVHVHDVGAEPLAGQLEGALRAGGGLEEQVDQRAPAQDVALLDDLAVVLGGLVGQIEQGVDLARRQVPRRSAGDGGGRRPWRMGWSLKRVLYADSPARKAVLARRRTRRRAQAWLLLGSPANPGNQAGKTPMTEPVRHPRGLQPEPAARGREPVHLRPRADGGGQPRGRRPRRQAADGLRRASAAAPRLSSAAGSPTRIRRASSPSTARGAGSTSSSSTPPTTSAWR